MVWDRIFSHKRENLEILAENDLDFSLTIVEEIATLQSTTELLKGQGKWKGEMKRGGRKM
jgi:hypothetical protein